MSFRQPSKTFRVKNLMVTLLPAPRGQCDVSTLYGTNDHCEKVNTTCPSGATCHYGTCQTPSDKPNLEDFSKDEDDYRRTELLELRSLLDHVIGRIDELTQPQSRVPTAPHEIERIQGFLKDAFEDVADKKSGK